jgi:putative transposase
MFSSRWVNVFRWRALPFLALLAAIRSLLWSRAQLQAEVLALRHQLLVLKRQCAGRRVHFQTSDRVLWSWLSRLWPRQGLLLVRPETVVRWHRQGFRLYWRWKSRSRRPGRPRIEPEI